jgi:spore coat polysaccharide biosynthesis protein SpsF (cytidylyltransferase family)
MACQPNVDYECNVLPGPVYSSGLDVEALRFDVLARAWREDTDVASREHVTQYVLRNSGRFTIRYLTLDISGIRWSVDTLADLMFVRRVFQHFGHDRFSYREVLALQASW